MKTAIYAISFLMTSALGSTLFAQGKRVPASAGRQEFIEVEKGVRSS
jgi:hypothetical protein